MNTNYGPEFERYNSQYGSALEKIGWMWWDTQPYVTAATTALAFFTAIPATLNLGNMEIAGQLASPKAFFVRAIRVKLLTNPFIIAAGAPPLIQIGSANDATNLLHNGVLRFTIGQKNYGEWPLWCLPAGGGIVVQFAAPGAAAGAVLDANNNGIQDPRAAYTMSVPVFIGPQINFRIDLLWPAGAVALGATTPLPIWVGLDGDLLRPVQ